MTRADPVADGGRRARQAGRLPRRAEGALRRAPEHRLGARWRRRARTWCGLPGLKTHAKALLVVRREGRGVRPSVRIGTGNCHAKRHGCTRTSASSAADREIAGRRRAVQRATGAARSPDYRKAIVAPDHMRKWFLREVERTSRRTSRARGTRIVLRMNSLVDARDPRALHRLAGGRAGGREHARDLLPAPGVRVSPSTSV